MLNARLQTSILNHFLITMWFNYDVEILNLYFLENLLESDTNFRL